METLFAPVEKVDARELAARPLQVGLSMNASVDTSVEVEGQALAQQAGLTPQQQG